jgi:GNAT superfamily N-acetyltransferase
MTLLIRWLNSTDEAAVLEIDRQSFPPEMAWDIEDVKRCFDGKHYGLVAVLDGLVIGYCVTRRHHSRPVLVSVATHPAFRRRGIATVLFREIAAPAPGPPPVHVPLGAEPHRPPLAPQARLASHRSQAQLLRPQPRRLCVLLETPHNRPDSDIMS